MPGSPSGTWLSSLLHLRWCIGRGHRWSRLISSSAHRGGVWSRLAQMAPYPKLGNGQNGESNIISFKLIDLRRVFDKLANCFTVKLRPPHQVFFGLFIVYCLETSMVTVIVLKFPKKISETSSSCNHFSWCLCLAQLFPVRFSYPQKH